MASQSKSESGSHAHTNRLINETSPYLLQHAHNPVDWYPWGEEAFEAARTEQKPIFLSIGYSTCYWCHVMERESFEDPELAAILNSLFIPVKVDREERPDVDDIYMKAVQILNNGQGGWPASVFLLPPPPAKDGDEVQADETWRPLQPFWAGTYFPPQPQMGRPSFRQVLEAISNAWHNQQHDVIAQAQTVAEHIEKELAGSHPTEALNESHISFGISALMRGYDETHGGFGQAPKFPQPSFLELLIETRDSVSDQSQRAKIDEAISRTLDKMAMGGMYDQVGGGFHRYSTDQLWIVPHFEKMLYDNGQLASLYARAATITNDAYYLEIAIEICEYVLRELTDPETGAFYSAQDAEVNHREGQNYLWTEESVRQVLAESGCDDELIDFAVHVYGLKNTNFRDPHHPEDPASNVLYLVMHPERIAVARDLTVDEVNARLRRINEVLYEVRAKRDQPGVDDKIIASWNGLMIAGFADAATAVGEDQKRNEFLEAATSAWDYIHSNMCNAETGMLYRTARGGVINDHSAFCEDYAFLAHGLLALHRATNDDIYLGDAKELVAKARELFWDEEQGGYFDTLEGQSDLFVRTKSTYDGATPCATSVMLHNLIDLYHLTKEDQYLDDALAAIHAISPHVANTPLATSNSTRALNRLLNIDDPRVAEVLGQSSAPTGTAVTNGPVTGQITPDAITFDDAGAASATITLEIAEGFHVNAHQPGNADVIPLRISFETPEGMAAEVDDYPDGSAYTVADMDLFVYTTNVSVPVQLSRATPDASGDISVTISYQVCTATACLPPQKMQLAIQIK